MLYLELNFRDLTKVVVHFYFESTFSDHEVLRDLWTCLRLFASIPKLSFQFEVFLNAERDFEKICNACVDPVVEGLSNWIWHIYTNLGVQFAEAADFHDGD